MRKHGLVAVIVLALGAADLAAAEVKGKLKAVDPAKSTITLDVDGKDKTFTLSKKVDLLVQDIRPYKPKKGLKDPVFRRKGLQVSLQTAKEEGKEVVTKLTVFTGRKG
jgi:hypothetical protein